MFDVVLSNFVSFSGRVDNFLVFMVAISLSELSIYNDSMHTLGTSEV